MPKGDSSYPNLIKKRGTAGAKEHMRSIRKKRTTKGAFSFMTKTQISEIGKKGANARWNKKENK